jgi:EspA/EspE family
VGVLDAFLSTWSNARETFGAGAVTNGAEFDDSARLRQMQSDLQTAAPDSRWQGAAASAYGVANNEHAAVFGKIADLDRKVAADVDRSAEVVTAGRRSLDEVRNWVLDAAAAAPKDQAGERMLIPIVHRGLSQIADIIQESNSELNTIGADIRRSADEYQALQKQKFAPEKESKEPASWATGDDETEDPAPDPADMTQWYSDWNEHVENVNQHNASRPVMANYATIHAYNAAVLLYNAEAQELNKESTRLVAEATLLGIEVAAPPAGES